MPVLEAISGAKKARGEVEPLLNSRDMPPGLSREQRRDWQRAADAARAPTKPGQVVVNGGSGGKRYLVRIDPGEDPLLQWSHERFESEKQLYVQRVRLALESDK